MCNAREVDSKVTPPPRKYTQVFSQMEICSSFDDIHNKPTYNTLLEFHRQKAFVRGYEIYPSRDTNFHFSKTALLQLDFPAFLRVRTWAATHHGEAVTTLVPTNAVALTNFHTTACLRVAGQRGHMRKSQLSGSIARHTCLVQTYLAESRSSPP
jgi:hypothetical protein